VFQGNPSRAPRRQKQLARRLYISAQINARTLRDNFLQIQREHQIEEGNLTKAVAIRQILNQERRQRCWRIIQSLTKPRSAGGISHVLTPQLDDNNREIGRTHIFDKEGMDNTLHSRNQSHFAQAEGTPFTRPPLLPAIHYDGCSATADAILDGIIPSTFDEYSTLLLQQFRRCRPPISHHIDFDEMCYSFRKWREQTTTSPSTKHLGIYKSLINATRYRLDHDILPDNMNSHIAMTALHIQHLLLSQAIDRCHTFNRWRTVHNFFLEKIPGRPLIGKRRVIHIYEADWNFVHRYFAAYKTSKAAAANHTITPEQGGGRPGRSSAEVATNTVLTYETIRLQRASGGIDYNDAKACYDRIPENLSNIALQREGYPKAVAQLHANTLSQVKYYIKHKLGIGTRPNFHSVEHPFHGSGQGATDSPA
jgi:hypothetical protein